ncbi:MAG: 6-phosphogluconolactonase [Gammaproteobacteria bacterium]|nr:6-phosphogluconolactonase [Gammaproteobacteria bacterium]
MDTLSHAAADRFVMLASRYLETTGKFNVALAGGGTPRSLYQLLASVEYRGRIDWSGVSFYFGDERSVPQEHADSNYRMARESLLDRIPITREQVFPFETRLDVRKAAAEYARLLQRNLPKADGLPKFDLVLLGMGDDGHTASLFPGTCILHDDRLAAAVYVEKLKTWRLSLTYPVINNADHIMFLISGESKAQVMQQLSQNTESHFPVSRIDARDELLWLLDEAAASTMETTR